MRTHNFATRKTEESDTISIASDTLTLDFKRAYRYATHPFVDALEDGVGGRIEHAFEVESAGHGNQGQGWGAPEHRSVQNLQHFNAGFGSRDKKELLSRSTLLPIVLLLSMYYC